MSAQTIIDDPLADTYCEDYRWQYIDELRDDGTCVVHTTYDHQDVRALNRWLLDAEGRSVRITALATMRVADVHAPLSETDLDTVLIGLRLDDAEEPAN